jgi:hypothetical protein
MKRTLICVLLLFFVFTTIIDAQRRRRSRRARRVINITCPTNLGGISNCPDKGCGTNLDPLLNQRKNLTFDPLNQPVKKRTVAWLKNREDPIVWFKRKDRTELIGFGEGQHIKVGPEATPQPIKECANCVRTCLDKDEHLSTNECPRSAERPLILDADGLR